MAKILITEKISPAGIDELRSAGHEIAEHLNPTPDQLTQIIADADALIVRSQTQVTDQLLAAAPKLKIIARAGIGVDNVDTEAATHRGIVVVNAPISNTLSAAEHTFGMLIAQARNIPQAHADLTAGNWNRAKFQGVELADKTLGVVGFGRIGQLVAERAAGFNMHILAHDPYISQDFFQQLGVENLPLEDLVGKADFLTLHVAKTPETTGIINAALLEKAKPSLRIINVSRGGIINEADLAHAIREGQVAGAALDVFEEEPPTDSPLLGLDQIVVTPHLGASTREAQEKAGISVARQVAHALEGRVPSFAVNIHGGRVPQELLAFLPLCEQLGGIFCSMVTSLPDSLELEFSGQIGEIDTKMGMLAMLSGLLNPVTEHPVSYVNVEDIAQSRGLDVRIVNTAKPKDYVNEVTLRGGGHEVGGTLLGVRSKPHIVLMEGHRVNLPPTAHMVAISNYDRPGVVGAVGNILGDARTNINDLDVGITKENEALILLSTDKSVSQEIVKKLCALEDVKEVRVIELDPDILEANSETSETSSETNQ